MDTDIERTAWEATNPAAVTDWETLLRPHFGIPDADVLAREIAAIAERHGLHSHGRWVVEDETYEVLIGDTIYDECDTLGAVAYTVGRCRAEIDADELVGEIRTRRIVRYLRDEKD